jgi:hypothetical protein
VNPAVYRWCSGLRALGSAGGSVVPRNVPSQQERNEDNGNRGREEVCIALPRALRRLF